MSNQASKAYVGLAVSKAPEPHESGRGSPGWCVQRRACGVLTIASVWVCNFKEKQQSSYSSSSSNPRLQWEGRQSVRSLRPPRVDARPWGCHGRRLVYRRGERGGWLVARLPIPLSSYLSSSSSSCFFPSPTPALLALRCASSCAGPGGLTGRNTCREKQRNCLRNIPNNISSMHEMCAKHTGNEMEGM